MFNRSAVFHAMADPTRRTMLVRRTVHGRRHVCRLEAEPLAAASRYLRFYEQF